MKKSALFIIVISFIMLLRTSIYSNELYYYASSWRTHAVNGHLPIKEVIAATQKRGYSMYIQDSSYCSKIQRLIDKNVSAGEIANEKLVYSTIIIIKNCNSCDTLGFRGFDFFYYNGNVYKLVYQELLDVVAMKMPAIFYENYELQKANNLNKKMLRGQE